MKEKGKERLGGEKTGRIGSEEKMRVNISKKREDRRVRKDEEERRHGTNREAGGDDKLLARLKGKERKGKAREGRRLAGRKG